MFYSGSETGLLRVIEWAGIALFTLTLLLLLLVLLMRARLIMRERRWQRFLSVWQPILMGSIEIATSNVPRLAHRDLPNFLLLWNHLHESLLDESKDHLNQIAYALSINEVALRMLGRRNLRDRLLAVITLGQLREPAAWNSLLTIAHGHPPLLSVTAARSLVMIDPGKAIPELLPLLASRGDWPPPRVADTLQTAGADVISDPIARAAIAASASALDQAENPVGEDEARPLRNAARLVRYLNLAYNVSAVPAARTIARSSHNPEVLAACLRLLNSAEDLEIVRRCLAHEAWPVRVQAAAAMGRIGEDQDAPGLIGLLSDKQWWVRYRAAQALARLPSMTVHRLKAIQTSQANPFARDMLAQILAEIALQ